jgi:ketosteroid isomerase-like protein
VDDDSAAVWTVVTDLYRAYLDPDRPRLQAQLAEDCTLWETAAPSLRTKSVYERRIMLDRRMSRNRST